ncbi:MAG: hypothetical protein WGN25_18510 [Candidatus Electrothrix sp. GW3-4]|uniref:hypothetical protein n=1 Tax=Candidatus Electrothrix sp. GW3-4 TaxID=3126740 RepID=UPI0030D45876
MSKAFIDTTILTDLLVKSGKQHNLAKKALANYETTLLPVYAIKEFKAGPLRNYVYAHNKLVSTESYSETIDAIQKLSRTPQRYKTSTALEALKVAHDNSIAKLTPQDLLSKYGDPAPEMDKIIYDESRLALKVIIFKAWKRRRKIATDVIFPLNCYSEKDPFEESTGLIQDKPVKCDNSNDCSVKKMMLGNLKHLELIKDAIENDSEKRENTNRLKVIKRILKHPRCDLNDRDCRWLGDAVFAFLCPNDAELLTTNLKDHEPIVSALGKKVVSPFSEE